MAATDLVITITARDQATPELRRVRQEVDETTKRGDEATKSFTLTGEAASAITRGVRLMGGSLASELNPQLGATIGQLARATSGSSLFASGLGGPVVAALAVATVATTQWISAVSEATAEQGKLNIAARSFDTGALQGAAKAAATELETMRLRAQSLGGTIRNLFTEGADAVNRFFGGLGGAAGELALANQKIAETLPILRIKELNEQLATQLGAAQKLAQIEAARADQFGDLDTLNEKLAQVTTNYVLQAGAARDALLATQAIERAQADARQASAEERATLAERQRAQLRGFDLQQNVGLAQLQASAQQSRERILSQRFLEGAVEPGQGFESATAGLTPEDLAKGGEVARKIETDRLQLARDTASALADQVGLTKEQQLQLSLTVVEADRRLKVAQAQSDEDKIAVINLEAQTKAANLLNAELLRTDATTGLQQGLRDIADEAASAGDRIRTELVSAYHDVSRSFSDIVVEGLAGDVDKVADIGKQLGKRLLAGFIDQLSSGLTAKVFSSLSQVFGVPSTAAGRPLLTAVPAVSSPFALAAGAASAGTALVGAASPAVAGSGSGGPLLGSTYLASTTGGAAASPALASGGVLRQAATAAAPGGSGVALLGQGLGIAKDVVSGFFGTSLSAYGVIAAYNAGGLAGVASAQSLVAAGLTESQAASVVAIEAGGAAAAEGTSAATGAGSAGIGGGGAAAGAGATGATVAAGVLAAAALAYTAYSAYQTGDVAGGAIGGAISGAALGTVIYPGIGTVVGLVAGAAIGAGAGYLGKQEQGQRTHLQREEAEIARTRQGLNSFTQGLQPLVTMEDLHAYLTAWGSGYTGGTSGLAVVTSVTTDHGEVMVGTVSSIYPVATAQDLREFGADTARVSVQAGIRQSELDAMNQTMTDAVRAKIREILQREEGILFAYDEALQTGAHGAAARVTRSTVLSYSRLGEVPAGTQDLSVVGNTLDNLTDDQAQKILERLAKVDRDRDLQILRIESDFGATVSVGHLTA